MHNNSIRGLLKIPGYKIKEIINKTEKQIDIRIEAYKRNRSYWDNFKTLNMRLIKQLLFLVMAVIFDAVFPLFCLSDVLYLKDGRVINGDIIEENNDFIKMDVSGMGFIVKYRNDKIDKIIIEEDEETHGKSNLENQGKEENLRFTEDNNIAVSQIISEDLENKLKDNLKKSAGFDVEIKPKDSDIKFSLIIPQENIETEFFLIQPKELYRNRRYPLFIFIHGRGGSCDNILASDYETLTSQDFFVLIPQAPNAYGDGFSWYRLDNEDVLNEDLEKDEQIILGLIKGIQKKFNFNFSKVVLSGFSQGGRISFFMGLRNPDIFDAIMPIGGYCMGYLLDDSYLKKIGNLKISIFHGTKDEVSSFLGIKKTYDELSSHGANVELNTYSLGHTYTTEMLKKIFDGI